jgi:hypothetical protein
MSVYLLNRVFVALQRVCVANPRLSVTSRFEIEFQEELDLLLPRKILEMKKIKHEFWIDSLLK